MAKNATAPLGAMFSILKRYGDMSYKEVASLILSEEPVKGGVSPISRVNDRTWILALPRACAGRCRARRLLRQLRKVRDAPHLAA